MRISTATLGASALMLLAAFATAHADVPMTGTFAATQACPAYQSFRKETNPGDVKLEPSKTYDLLSKNKPDATHYRVTIEGAQPAERWVEASCGTVDPNGQQAHTPRSVPGQAGDKPDGKSAGNATSGAASGARPTHVLAMSWQPTFCAQHADKTECKDLKSTNFATKKLSLHGLWPQPRGTQYCNVPSDQKQADRDHDWNALPEPAMNPDTRTRLSAVMPGVQSNLQRHEWIVHGTCFGADADAYFNRAATLAESVNASKVSQLFADNVGRTLSTEAIRAAFDESFGPGAGARVTVSCRGRGDNRKITEMVINLAGDVTGSGALGDLVLAAQTVPPGCPSGLVGQAPN